MVALSSHSAGVVGTGSVRWSGWPGVAFVLFWATLVAGSSGSRSDSSSIDISARSLAWSAASFLACACAFFRVTARRIPPVFVLFASSYERATVLLTSVGPAEEPLILFWIRPATGRFFLVATLGAGVLLVAGVVGVVVGMRLELVLGGAALVEGCGMSWAGFVMVEVSARGVTGCLVASVGWMACGGEATAVVVAGASLAPVVEPLDGDWAFIGDDFGDDILDLCYYLSYC